MARKKKNDAMSFLILATIVLLVLIALATPIVLVFGWLYNYCQLYSIRKRLTKCVSDFWLTSEEKVSFKTTVNELSEVMTIIDDANTSGEESGISRNRDGSFSARSNLGKEIRQILDEYEPMKTTLTEALDELQNLPELRWQSFNKFAVRAHAFILSIGCWLAVLVYFSITLSKSSVTEVFQPYLALATNLFRGKETIPFGDGDIKMVAVATITAFISYFAISLIFKNRGTKYSPIPPNVTMANIDNY